MYKKQHFHYSAKVKAITLLVIALLVGLTLYATHASSDGNALTVGIVICICWIPIVLTMAFVPIYYIRSNEEVMLRLVCFKLRYRLEEYSIETYKLPKRGIIRTFGSGGFFGCFGWFYHKDIGSFLLFSTGSGNSFLKLTHKGKRNIILIEE